MRLDDLFGAGQAEPRILAEALMRAIGIEALEHLLEGVGSDAWAVIVDQDLDVVLDPPAGDPHPAFGR